MYLEKKEVARMEGKAAETEFLTLDSVKKNDLIRIMKEEVDCIVWQIVSRSDSLVNIVLQAVKDYASSSPGFKVTDIISLDLLPAGLYCLLKDRICGIIDEAGEELFINLSIEDGLLETDGVSVKSE